MNPVVRFLILAKWIKVRLVTGFVLASSTYRIKSATFILIIILSIKVNWC